MNSYSIKHKKFLQSSHFLRLDHILKFSYANLWFLIIFLIRTWLEFQLARFSLVKTLVRKYVRLRKL